MRHHARDDPSDIPPPHLRLQPQQPFVRPLSGLDHDQLGKIYADIGLWRSRLKNINVEIAEAQHDSYNDIADGVNIKGWLLVGRGIHFLYGTEMIEGRSKDDIRWPELQHDGGLLSTVAFWIAVVMTGFCLAAACVFPVLPSIFSAFYNHFAVIATSGLALADSPDVAHFLPWFRPLAGQNSIGVGLATTLAPACAATLCITIGLVVVRCT
jgi:hypothetical protein